MSNLSRRLFTFSTVARWCNGVVKCHGARAEKANVDTPGLNHFPLVDARLVFIVHPSSPVKSLTLAQVKAVMAGTISNWKQLGRPDLAIVGIVEAVGGGVRMVTDEGVMHGTPIAAAVKAVKGDKIAGLEKPRQARLESPTRSTTRPEPTR